MKKQTFYWSGVISVGVVLGLSLQFVRAWTEPSQNPPLGNVGAPINTGGNNQVKAGPLEINSNNTANSTGLKVYGNTEMKAKADIGEWSYLVNGLTVTHPDGPMVVVDDYRTGQTNWAQFIADRGEIAQGYAEIIFQTNWWRDWAIGTDGNTRNLRFNFGHYSDPENYTPFYFTSTGNLGIGTLSPQEKLQISGGKARADDFCLNSNPSKCLSSPTPPPSPSTQGLYGWCKTIAPAQAGSVNTFGFYSSSVPPAQQNNGACGCQSGYTPVRTGSLMTSLSGQLQGDSSVFLTTSFEHYWSCYKN